MHSGPRRGRRGDDPPDQRVEALLLDIERTGDRGPHRDFDRDHDLLPHRLDDPAEAAQRDEATAAARRSLRQHVAEVLPDLERLYLDDLMQTHDAAEGIAAFIEKRVPIWTDR